MPASVIDNLELVEIYVQQCMPDAIADRAQQAIQLTLELVAVGESGQRIVECEVLDGFLGEPVE